MAAAERILIVEDDASVAAFIEECLRIEGYRTEIARDGESADRRLREARFDLVLSDLKLPGLDGLELLSRHGRSGRAGRWVMVSGLATIEDAVRAMRIGARDFLTKPIPARELLHRVRRALEGRETAEARAASGPVELVGESAPFRHAVRQLELVAPVTTTVLIFGETGTGKEVAARYLHDRSPRRRKPFVSIHCGAIPDALLEDELFGHVKGAFTGAVASRPGCFEMANGGTLFLDEIGTMSLSLQSKLLRVLQDLEVRRLGDTRSQRVDVRVVAATNADLPRMVEKGEFRADLYYRLSVFPVHMPSLQERGGDDVVLLARHFCRRIAERLGVGPKRLAEAAEERLRRSSWPGNVRQLENMIERAVVVSQGRDTVEPADLLVADGTPMGAPAGVPEVEIPAGGISFETVVSQLERQLILKSLEIANGNKKQAADLLRLKRTTLIEKLKRLSAPA